jgi:hypothetical protein
MNFCQVDLTSDSTKLLGLAICMHLVLIIIAGSLDDTSLREADATEPATVVSYLIGVFLLFECQSGSVRFEGEGARRTRRTGEGVEGTEGMDKGALLEHE